MSPQTMDKLKAGDTAPEIALPTWPEGELKLSGLRGKYVVLYFYPRDNTSGCTTESCDFRDSHGDFEGAGAVVLGISRDSVKSHQGFSEKFGFPFRLLSDTEEQACTAYGVIKMKNKNGKQVRGIERSTFLIDPDGNIARIWRQVKVQDHAAEVLASLKEASN